MGDPQVSSKRRRRRSAFRSPGLGRALLAALFTLVVGLFASTADAYSPPNVDSHLLITADGVAGGWLGHSVSAADLNGDGHDDAIVSEWAAGRVYIYFGGPSPDPVPDLTLTGTGRSSRLVLREAATPRSTAPQRARWFHSRSRSVGWRGSIARGRQSRPFGGLRRHRHQRHPPGAPAATSAPSLAWR